MLVNCTNDPKVSPDLCLTVTETKLPEIEGLGIDVRFREQGSDIVKAALHYGKMQSWRDDRQKTKMCKDQKNMVIHDIL